MRNSLFFLFIPIFVLIFLISCSAAPISEKQNVLQTEQETLQSVPNPSEPVTETALSLPACDIDLTEYNSNMVYAEVYNMMNEPEHYVGKRIRMEGICATYDTPDRLVYGCIIADATACCKQGMEFVLSDDYAPEDYPKPGSTIVVSGTFHLYDVGEFVFCDLVDGELEAQTPPES